MDGGGGKGKGKIYTYTTMGKEIDWCLGYGICHVFFLFLFFFYSGGGYKGSKLGISFVSKDDDGDNLE